LDPVSVRHATSRRGRTPAAAPALIRAFVAARVASLLAAGERGSILILVGLSTLIIIGSAGLAVDVGRLYATKAELSRAVDSAALAGVLEFNGQASGLTAAQTKAEAYMVMNEPSLSPSCNSAIASRVCVVADGATSTLRINASKSARLYFLPIFGLTSSVVSAKAIAGFNDQTLDAVMVIDSTYSMNGSPITNAKAAAINFKNVLLGSSPSGNVVVGVAPLRGCYRDSPMPASKTDCIDNATQVQQLTSNSTTLDTKINALTPGTVSATNICTGLGKGYEVLNNASYNHQTAQNNRRFLVLLSDGDNVYFGDYVYQASPPSPNTFTIGGSNYACQPPNTCTGWGLYCFTGTYIPPGTAFASDGFESNDWSGGTGWGGDWTTTGTDYSIITTNTPDSGTYHARLRGNGSITRVVDLSIYASSALLYKAKSSSLESGDNVILEISHNNSSWTTLRDHNSNVSSYTQYTANLDPYVGDSTVYIRWRGSMGDTSDNFYLDSIAITNDSSIGYLNGQDGQNYTSCSEQPGARERQVDVQTLNIANAIKAQGVEIFVVAFSACSNSDGSNVYNNSGNQTCQSQANPVSSPPVSGRVGDTTTETTANTRLAKCIASSSPGTNDHFWFETNAANLPSIFTTIAAQIAHRLVE
jgi:Flp pilus assembly protein TadG